MLAVPSSSTAYRPSRDSNCTPLSVRATCNWCCPCHRGFRHYQRAASGSRHSRACSRLSSSSYRLSVANLSSLIPQLPYTDIISFDTAACPRPAAPAGRRDGVASPLKSDGVEGRDGLRQPLAHSAAGSEIELQHPASRVLMTVSHQDGAH